MTCKEAIERISGSIDRENTEQEDRELFQHLKNCPHCQAIMAAFRKTDEDIAALAQEAPVGLSAKVMDAIKAESPRKTAKHRSWPIWATAAALALVIGLKAGDLPLMENKVQDVPQTAPVMSMPAENAYAAPDPQILAEERQACVVLLHEPLTELEDFDREVLEDGSVLYLLPSADLAAELIQSYGLERYGSDSAEKAYALLIS